jgi:hypothetical protein
MPTVAPGVVGETPGEQDGNKTGTEGGASRNGWVDLAQPPGLERELYPG